MSPCVHHVVLCVHPDRLDAVASCWRELGFSLTDIELDDVGLHVLLDWEGGLEIITPVTRRPESERFWSFLERHGEGVFSLVVAMPDIDVAVASALARGSVVEYREHRRIGDRTIDEVQVSPLHGTPLTFLQTDLD